jgi:hypothetical protein
MSRAGPDRSQRVRRAADDGNPIRRWWVVAAAVVGVLVAVIALQVAGGDDDRDGPEAEEAGIAHVHGLGVNPADDDLYVATHHGVFRIDEKGEAARVGDRAQDTMGFTVAGPDRFLASGHPDPRDAEEGKRPLLGLIESTDAGETWESVSLDGEADFHGLSAAHGLVYGYDSTGARFMVRTEDGAWQARSNAQLADFAVDPSDADHVVAAGTDGLLDSVDGGRSWSRVDGPVLQVLSWEPHGGLFGAAPDGTVHRSFDGGRTWEGVGGLAGRPEALLAGTEVLYAAAAGEDGRTGIYRSEDAGTTWSLFYRDPA